MSWSCRKGCTSLSLYRCSFAHATHICMHTRQLIIKCVRELLLLMFFSAFSQSWHPWCSLLQLLSLMNVCVIHTYSFLALFRTCDCDCRQISLLRFYLSVGASFNIVYRSNLSNPYYVGAVASSCGNSYTFLRPCNNNQRPHYIYGTPYLDCG